MDSRGAREELRRLTEDGQQAGARAACPSGSRPCGHAAPACLEQRAERGHRQHVAVLGASDTLSPDALYEMAAALERLPNADVLYSDESIDGRGGPVGARFKPDWSPELMLSHNYVGRLAMVRAAALGATGGFADEYGDAAEWEALLRVARLGGRLHRIARCLYHRRDAGAAADVDSAARVLAAQAEHAGIPARIIRSGGAPRLAWGIHGQPKVSIVIPNRNAAAILETCVAGLLERTAYRTRKSQSSTTHRPSRRCCALYRRLERDACVRIVPFDRAFNFSAACNSGASAATGELLLFLNNDIEIIEADWLEELVRWAQRPHVGVVGAKLLYPDRTIQHAGVVFGLGLVGHIFARAREDESGLFGSAETYRNYLAVTGACQMIRRDVFRQLGGFDERFRLSFSDVVLCLEAWKAGYRVVYTPYARLRASRVLHEKARGLAGRPGAARPLRPGLASGRGPLFSSRARYDIADSGAAYAVSPGAATGHPGLRGARSGERCGLGPGAEHR